MTAGYSGGLEQEAGGVGTPAQISLRAKGSLTFRSLALEFEMKVLLPLSWTEHLAKAPLTLALPIDKVP